MIPAFNEYGNLPEGNHKANLVEFTQRFINNADRQRFVDLLINLIDYAKSVHASSILFGGSFITSEPLPNDIDCVLLFNRSQQIPTIRPSFTQGAGILDLYFASADNPDIVSSFRKLFSVSKNESNVGTIELDISGNGATFDNLPDPSEELLQLARTMYGYRHSVHVQKRRKVLVLVHGIRTHAEWYSDVSFLGSLNGWTIAPFIYGYQNVDVFLNRNKRREIVDVFRSYLTDVCQLSDTQSVSVIAHSFGTYIAMNYIMGFDDPPTRYDTLILTGGIVDEKLDMQRLYGKVGHILNEIAPNDEWVNWARRANLARDELFGKAGTEGFNQKYDRLVEHNSEIFTHNNVIKRDVIKARWMPTLDANFGSVARDRKELGLN